MFIKEGEENNSLSGLTSNNPPKNITTPKNTFLAGTIDSKDVLQEHQQDLQKEFDTLAPSNQAEIKATVDAAYAGSLKKRAQLNQIGGSKMPAKKPQKKRTTKTRKSSKKSSLFPTRPKRKVAKKTKQHSKSNKKNTRY